MYGSAPEPRDRFELQLVAIEATIDAVVAEPAPDAGHARGPAAPAPSLLLLASFYRLAALEFPVTGADRVVVEGSSMLRLAFADGLASRVDLPYGELRDAARQHPLHLVLVSPLDGDPARPGRRTVRSRLVGAATMSLCALLEQPVRSRSSVGRRFG